MATSPRAVRVVSPTRPRFDVSVWSYMRWSGVLLVPLAFGHLVIMHLINNVHVIDACFVYYRWALLGWRVYDALLLWLAYIHGLLGLRYVIDDYVHHPGLRQGLKGLAVVMGVVLLTVGSIALIGGVRVTELPGGC